MVAKTTENPQREELKQKFVDRLQLECSVSPDEASDKQIYQVLSDGRKAEAQAAAFYQ